MHTRHVLLSALACLMAPAAAVAQGPSVPPPRHADRMTVALVENITWRKATAERADKDAWPNGGRVTVSDCKARSRRLGTCKYVIDEFVNKQGEPLKMHYCTRRVVTRITKRTHRVKTRVRKVGCETS